MKRHQTAPSEERRRIFNPWKQFVGSFIPNALCSYPGLTPGAKLLWAKLAQHAGKDGHCHPPQTLLAEELGITERHVRKLLTELEADGWIVIHKPTGKEKLQHLHNSYEFVLHSALESEIAPPERNCGSGRERNCGSAPSKENPSKENPNNEMPPNPQRGNTHDPSLEEAFALFWSLYPKRQGANPKGPAQKRFYSLVQRKVATAEELIAGVRGYALFCKQTGKVGTEFVKQAQFWLSEAQKLWVEYAAFAGSGERADDFEYDQEVQRRAMRLADRAGEPDAPRRRDRWEHFLSLAREELDAEQR